VSCEDDNVLQGFQARWMADADLPTLVPGGLLVPPNESGPDTVPEQQSVQRCYATITSEPGTAPRYGAPVLAESADDQAHYIDSRRVTLTVYGLKPDVVAAASAVRSAFHWQPRGAGALRLDVPNADVLSVVPAPGDGTLAFVAAKRGKDVWSYTSLLDVSCDRVPAGAAADSAAAAAAVLVLASALLLEGGDDLLLENAYRTLLEGD
jgi:hypothetical protein